MTDDEKIKWFDETMDWVRQWDTAENARTAVDESAEAATDLFFDVVDQYEKVRKAEDAAELAEIEEAKERDKMMKMVEGVDYYWNSSLGYHMVMTDSKKEELARKAVKENKKC